MRIFTINKLILCIILILSILGCNDKTTEIIKQSNKGAVSAILTKEVHNATVSDVYYIKLKCGDNQKLILKASKVDDIKMKWKGNFLSLDVKADRIHNFQNYFWCKDSKEMIKIILISN